MRLWETMTKKKTRKCLSLILSLKLTLKDITNPSLFPICKNHSLINTKDLPFLLIKTIKSIIY